MSLRWSSYVTPNSPKGGLKMQIGRFSSEIALLLKKVCYKVSLCENCQRQSCRAFIGLTIHAKIINVVSWVDLAGYRSVFVAHCYKYSCYVITRSIFLHGSYVILMRSPTNALGCGPFGSSSCDSQTHHHYNFACCGLVACTSLKPPLN